MSDLILKNVRLSFPYLFEPTSFEGGPLKYKASFLVPKSSPLIKVVEDDIKRLAREKWEKKADGILAAIRGNPNRFCWQDGDLKDADGYADHYVLTANNKTRPTVLDRDKSPLTAQDGRPYAGCYVVGIVEFFTYGTPGNGISASLKGVQFYKDGEAFSGGRPADPSKFEAYEDDDDDSEALA